MKYLKLSVQVFLLTFLFLSSTSVPASACSCLAQTTEQNYDNSTAVFSGKIVKISGTTATFEVLEVFKGDVQSVVSVSTPQDSAACGLSFSESSDWVIFANRESATSYSANLCSGSFNYETSASKKNADEEKIYNELVTLAGDDYRNPGDASVKSNILYVKLFGGLLLIGTIVGFGIYYFLKDRSKK